MKKEIIDLTPSAMLFALTILSAMVLALWLPAHAQKQATTPRIGILRAGAPPDANLELFLQGLRDLGYIEGKNILIELRFVEESKIALLSSQGTWFGYRSTRSLPVVREPFSLSRKQPRQSLSFSSARVIQLEPAWLPVSRSRVAI